MTNLLELTITLVVFLFPLAFSPGPGNLFFAANGARFGFFGVLQANLAYHIATWIVTLLIGLGIGSVATRFPNFLLTIKYLGSAYIFYLAWRLMRAHAVTAADAKIEPKTINWLDGVILLILNPKAYLIISVMFAQFISPHNNYDGEQLMLVVWISTVFTLNNLVAFSLWIYASDKLLRRFRSPEQAKKLNLIFGVVLAAVAVWMLLDSS